MSQEAPALAQAGAFSLASKTAIGPPVPPGGGPTGSMVKAIGVSWLGLSRFPETPLARMV